MKDFSFYTLLCFFNISLGLIIKYKTDFVLKREKINYKAFKNMLDCNRSKSKYISNLSYSYFDDFIELILSCCVPVVNIFTGYNFVRVLLSHKTHLTYGIKLVDKIELNKTILEITKLKRYDNTDFYDDLSKLLKDDSFEYKEVILKSLNMLLQYIREYESVKTISKEDFEYKEELLSKLNESILKFKEMSKKLITLHNKNHYSLNELNEFNSLLDNITKDIVNEKAIFIKGKGLEF